MEAGCELVGSVEADDGTCGMCTRRGISDASQPFTQSRKVCACERRRRHAKRPLVPDVLPGQGRAVYRAEAPCGQWMSG
eukprot:7391611-Prymnesium_polylepis.3